MTSHRRPLRHTLTLTVTVLSLTSVAAQVSTTLTDRDRAEIQALSTAYGPALLGCKAEAYADLFATPGGYFGSSSRGEVRERQALIEMVLSYDRCRTPPPARASAEPAGSPAGQGRRAALPSPVIEWAPEGAKARIVNSSGGGYYDDVYVKTPKGWRFKSRNVVSDAELAARLTTQDFIEIRQLAGDDHGHYENLYGGSDGPIGPRSLTTDRDNRPFRSSGLRLTPTPDGVRGLAYLRNNGGHYEDLYMKTPQGWRIKERKYFPPENGK
jgi:hypothetical protein